ncbi:uncharacterized protein METZ01_LOCUS421791 [marine metagenome]|uniref:Uncharacterized protein n=1 Tax=marine metagenome TaxID=408172 RepID=A0A382XCM2_9ZZZZ
MIFKTETEVYAGIEVVGDTGLESLVRLIHFQDVSTASPEDSGQGGGQSSSATELADGNPLVDQVGSTSPESVQFSHLNHRLSASCPAQEPTQVVDGERSGDAVCG